MTGDQDAQIIELLRSLLWLTAAGVAIQMMFSLLEIVWMYFRTKENVSIAGDQTTTVNAQGMRNMAARLNNRLDALERRLEVPQ